MKDTATQDGGSAARRDESEVPPRAKQIGRLLAEMVNALPVLDKKILDAALAEMREHPRASLHYLFEQFTSASSATRAVLGHLLRLHAGADVVDNLNGLIFDSAQDAWTKVLANDILAELESPVDADVFSMSVPEAEELQKKLPSRVLRLLAEGNVEAAVERARALEPADRYLILHVAAERQREYAPAFLNALAQDDEATTAAVVSAVGAERLVPCVPLLLDLQRTAGRRLQKFVKRTLFDLRRAGVEIPEEKPPAGAPSAEVRDDGLPVYRAMVSNTSPEGRLLVIVARERPTGRLKVFSVVVDFWKQGIEQAALRLDMSRSSFERFITSQSGSRPRLNDASVADCRSVVARGLRVAREFGSPIPLDFGLGKSLLGAVDEEAAAIASPFPCSKCGKGLGPETVGRIRAAASYHNMQVETRCGKCRNSPVGT